MPPHHQPDPAAWLIGELWSDFNKRHAWLSRAAEQLLGIAQEDVLPPKYRAYRNEYTYRKYGTAQHQPQAFKAAHDWRLPQIAVKGIPIEPYRHRYQLNSQQSCGMRRK